MILANVVVGADGTYHVRYFDDAAGFWKGFTGTNLFMENTATVTLPDTWRVTNDEGFRMSAFTDNSVSLSGCVVAACLYTYRDEMRLE